MPFSVITLICELGTLLSASSWVVILVVMVLSLRRARVEEGCMTCSSLCTRRTPWAVWAALPASSLRSARGVWPASRTTPL
ncbi:hypothetical protein D3C72_2088060 [compost metagenome]